MCLRCVDPDLRQLASAGSIFLFQQFGYFMAPIISGAISNGAPIAHQPDVAWAVVMNWSVLGLAGLCVARHFSAAAAAREHANFGVQLATGNDLSTAGV